MTSVGGQAGGDQEVPVGAAPRHPEVEQALVEPVARDDLAVEIEQPRVGVGVRDSELGQRAREARPMGRKVDQTAAHHGRDLIDGIGEQEAPIEDRDPGLGLGQPLVIHVNGSGHRVALRRNPKPRHPAR